MKETIKKFLPIIKYLLIAFFDTLVSYAVYYIVLFINPVLYILGSVLGFTASTLSAFFLNTKFVFTPEGEAPEYTLTGLVKTFSTYGFTGVVTYNLLLLFWVEIIHVPKTIAPILCTTINFPINFLLNKYWTYKKR